MSYFAKLDSSLQRPTSKHNAAPAAELAQVGVTLGNIAVLDGFDLAIEMGEVTVLLGPAGAGKTTALRVLTGHLRPDRGTARLFGMDPRAMAARARLGVMLDSLELPRTLGVGEIVVQHSAYYPTARPVDETLRLAGLDALRDCRIGALDAADTCRLHYALAICGHPDLLVLDEPAGRTNEQLRRLLWTNLRQEADAGAAVLIVTRDLDDADAPGDRIVVIADGKIVADDTAATMRPRLTQSTIRCRTALSVARLRGLDAVSHVDRVGAESRIVSTDVAQTLRVILQHDHACEDLRIAPLPLHLCIAQLTGATVDRA